MDFYTMVLRKSGDDWVALCLENGLVGQGITKEESIKRLREAIESFEDISKTEEDVYSGPISIKELHEFLTIEGKELVSQTFELRAVNAQEYSFSEIDEKAKAVGIHEYDITERYIGDKSDTICCHACDQKR